MADTNEEALKNAQMQAQGWLAEEYNGKKFIQILADQGESFDLTNLSGCLALKKKHDEWKKTQEPDKEKSSGNEGTGKPGGTEGGGQPKESEENGGTLTVRQVPAKEPEENQNKDWIEQKRESWTKWSEQEHQPAYTYDEDKEFKEGLKFDVYKDAEKKEKLASVQYNAPRDVTISGEDGKVPPLEFFDKMVKEAKEVDHVPGVTFSGEMTPEFQTRLAVACIKNGLPMTGFEGKIDLNLLSEEERAGLGDKLTKEIDYRNKYIDAKSAAQARLSNDETKNKPFDLSKIGDVNDAAIFYAACSNAGVKVDGVEKVFTNSPEGLIHNPDFDLMPKEAQETIAKHNKDIHNQMLDRIKGKSRVPGPVVAEKETPLAEQIIPTQEAEQVQTPLRSARGNDETQKKFQNFVMQGLGPRE